MIEVIEKDKVETVELELNCKCQLQCSLCFKSFSQFKNQIMPNDISLDIIKKLIEQFKNIKKINLNGLGSEPTLYSHLFSLIEFLHSKKIAIDLYTNGQLNNDDFWKKLAKSLNMNDQIFFTICGSTQEIHEKYRRNSSLRVLLKNNEIINVQNKKNNCIFIKFKYNSSDIDKAVKQYSKKFHSYEIINTIPMNERFNLLNKEDFNIADDEIHSLYLESFNKTSEASFLNFQCKAKNQNQIIIDNFGNIYPCYCSKLFNLKCYNLKTKLVFKLDKKCCIECSNEFLKNLEKNQIESFYEC